MAALAGLSRPDHEAVRWTAPEAWHLTLLFVGEVPESHEVALTGALKEAAQRCGPAVVTLGPALEDLGGHLVAPVKGLEAVAGAVSAAVTAAGIDTKEAVRPFRGHLTVARSRARWTLPAELIGAPVQATWTIDEITLVRSRLGGGGSSYEVLAAAPLRR
jgi:RNA 2',3'-cyclic 3'-phosphodiesterase